MLNSEHRTLNTKHSLLFTACSEGAAPAIFAQRAKKFQAKGLKYSDLTGHDGIAMDRAVSATVQRKVPFYDVDMMHVVWNGHYWKYFEEARQALFAQQGIPYFDEKEGRGWVFPVIRSEVKFIHPLRLGDEFLCTATLKEAKVKIVVDFEIRRAADEKVCARGRSEQAAVKLPEMEMAFMIPEEVQNALWSRKQ